MHAKIFSATTIGVDAHLVEVEVDLSFGMLEFHIVGLPNTAIKESRRRIYTALKNAGFRLPEKKITVNLAPADVKKEGTLFDLPIALGILQASNLLEIPRSFLHDTVFLGELSLDGGIRPIKGALTVACDLLRNKKGRLIVPQANAHEAAMINDIEVIGVEHIIDLVAFLRGEKKIEPTVKTDFSSTTHQTSDLDFSHVKGQAQAKRALQIAAAGRHNILFIGPPGAGKTMLAKRLPTIMPPMSFDEVLQTSKIYSISGKLGNQSLITRRPFRNPHHTASSAGLIGGGSTPQPGEISLAHHGILFLDELTEFKRSTLEVLRQPLENKTVSISRVQHTLTFPASFLLVAALNPCPCGFFGDSTRSCMCSPLQINRYLQKLSGPLLDRIDLQVNVQALDYDAIKTTSTQGTGSQELYAAVEKAVRAQKQRFGTTTLHNNAMPPEQIERWCVLTSAAELIMKKAFNTLKLSMRGYHKVLKVARTIADLAEHEVIDVPHIQEALMYRSLDHYLEKVR